MPEINIADLEFSPAYSGDRKCGIRGTKEVRNKPGVYFIKEDGELVYIGMSRSCVYDALYRHFQCWVPDNRTVHKYKRLTYKYWLKTHKYEVALVFLDVQIVQHVEKINISNYQPRDNKYKYDNYAATTTNFSEEFNNDLTTNNINIADEHRDLPF